MQPPDPAEGPGRPAADLVVLAEVLDLLADVFGDPRSGARVRAAALAEAAGTVPALARLQGPLTRLGVAAEDDLDVEFARLFLAGRHAVAHPYESFYRSGRLMDPGCLEELDALLSAAGVQQDGRERLPADHLSVELGFLALLLRGVAHAAVDSEGPAAIRSIAVTLLAGHLTPFVTAFSGRLTSLVPAAYFAAAGELLVEAGVAVSRHPAFQAS